MQSLLKRLKPGDVWVPMYRASEILGVHPSQVRRDRVVLESLNLITTYRRRSNGFSLDVFEMLCRYRDLVREEGQKKAEAKMVKFKSSQSRDKHLPQK